MLQRPSRLLLPSLLLGVLSLLATALLAAPPVQAAEPVVAHGSVEQVYATGLTPGAKAELLNSGGAVVATQKVTSLGGVLFRKVAPHKGYRLRVGGITSAPVQVHDAGNAPWNPDVYDQTINSTGYQYLTTRDGTQLALTVHPPLPPAGITPIPGLPLPNLPDGLPTPSYLPPYPTLIEYSGYGYAAPDAPVSGIAAVANMMGFAVVDVNIRGTGCSGGAFDFFEPLESLDGYDVIETIARQPWVRGHKVGMLGISYGGISQLFTAQTQPPSLAAITPLSVIDAVPTTLYPGGIRNDGFAVAWAAERQKEAQPAGQGLEGTQPYAEKQISEGDTVCKDNQVLHANAADLMTKIEQNSTYYPSIADPLDPTTFVDKINVPVFMACQWQDEQTGGHCPSLVSRMTGTDKKWFTFTNGVHTDSLAPETINKLYDFLQIYVAKQAPIINSVVLHGAAPLVYQTALGVPKSELMTIPLGDPVQSQLTLAAAQAEFEKQPSVRVLFNNGAGSSPLTQSANGDPYPTFEHSFTTLPVPGTQARSWYLGPKGTLTDARPKGTTVNRYTADASALPLTDFLGETRAGGLWGNKSQWSWDWRTNPAGTSVSYVSPPLKSDTVVVGAGAVQVWARSSTKDVDFVATVSEIDPDGNETFVQSGYLRGSMRKLSTDSDNIMKRPSSLLEPVLSLKKSDLAPMPQKSFTKLTIPLYYEGHPYRAGTRIKVTLAAPNGTQPIWSFQHTVPTSSSRSAAKAATARVEIATSPRLPSRLVLPVVPGVAIGAGQPPCGSLRNQPCREFNAFTNLVTPVTSTPSTGTGGTGGGDNGTGGSSGGGDNGTNAAGQPGSTALPTAVDGGLAGSAHGPQPGLPGDPVLAGWLTGLALLLLQAVRRYRRRQLAPARRN